MYVVNLQQYNPIIPAGGKLVLDLVLVNFSVSGKTKTDYLVKLDAPYDPLLISIPINCHISVSNVLVKLDYRGANFLGLYNSVKNTNREIVCKMKNANVAA